MDFSMVNFKGKFREYQQRVLDNSSKFLSDGKINIVAAPGSGKTILGLELIRRINSPCIIFTPTTTIRQQWGQRFKESFLDEKLNIDEYISNDLNDIKLINVITYQALHSVINRIKISEDDEQIDYSNIDIFNLVLEKGIKTICLDEAHHLQNEWQRALEKFIKGLSKDIKIISLTATPPYDSTPAEWDRYIAVCGEIDDEIFVPELVKEKTICPHQDYIIFNYPTDKETEAFGNHRVNSLLAMNQLRGLSFLNEVNEKLNSLFQINEDYIYSNYKFIVALFIFLNDAKIEVNKSYFKTLTNSKEIPDFNLKYAERAYQFLLDEDSFLSDVEKEELVGILKEHSLIVRGKVRLDLNDRLKRNLVSSCGKLHSIVNITNSEYSSLKENLRMLILTDYIKKEEVVNIGYEKEIDNISIVSIFEELRKNTNINIGCLSGGLVILPLGIKDVLIKNYNCDDNLFKINMLNNTNYGIYIFKGNNKIKVDIVSRLFEDGYINVLIGTQALLGEGWDSPCINSLILASYVGSFMLSNQMRGRAIRTYKNYPDKTANIWHLVTIEPEYVFENSIISKVQKYLKEDKKTISSNDYETLCRRFECFVGPNYDTGEIESGIERITYIKPPYNKNSFQKINARTMELAKDRSKLKTTWEQTLSTNAKTVVESRVPKDAKVPAFTFQNFFLLALSTSIISGCSIASVQIITRGIRSELSILVLAILFIISLFVIPKTSKLVEFLCKHISPSRSFISISKAILKSFKELNLIQDGATIMVKEDDFKIYTSISIKNATLYEQNLFNTAIKELLTPIDNPKYLILKKNVFGKYDYSYSFACPTIFGKNANNVNVFKDNLKKSLGSMEIKFVHNQEGRKLLVKARRRSFISINTNRINKRQKVTKYD